MGKKVIVPEELLNLEYDAVLVANLFSQEIYRQCKDLGINIEKVIFLYANCVLHDLNTDYDFLTEILGSKYANIVKNRYHVIRGVEEQEKLCLSDREKQIHDYQEQDYVRMKCFELAVKEIRKKYMRGGGSCRSRCFSRRVCSVS